MSVHTWGENPNGIWQMRINDRVNILFLLINWFIKNLTNFE